jgi:hypothetical protein
MGYDPLKNLSTNQIWQIPHEHKDLSFGGKFEKTLLW